MTDSIPSFHLEELRTSALIAYTSHNPRANLSIKDVVFEITNETELTTDTASDSESGNEHLDSSTQSCLQQISPYFDVMRTVYGGRGCFASSFIPKGTIILKSDRPVGSSVAKVFKKEVCLWCFAYHNGKSMKHRLQSKIYFCSEECQSEFVKYDNDGTLTNALISFDDAYAKNECDVEDYEVPEVLDESAIRQIWKDVEEWDNKVSKMKPTKRARFLPKLTKDDYAEARYTISVVHSMHQKLSGEISKEMELFHTLESSEPQKVEKYPYLTLAYSNIFKFLRLTCPDSFQKFITPQSVRDIIGRNLTNAFGIWSPTTTDDEEREYLGFGVYPSASFFNHSCAFNVKKLRELNTYIFKTTEDIQSGTELCISYGITGDETLESREATLAEWFFKCGCSKCTFERS